MQSLRTVLAAAIGATLTLGGAALTAGPVAAADDTITDYSRYQIGPGVYPAYPPAMAEQDTEGGGVAQLLYFDCEGRFGPPAPCDDPDFWLEWS